MQFGLVLLGEDGAELVVGADVDRVEGALAAWWR